MVGMLEKEADIYGAVVGVAVALTILSWIVVSLRVYVRGVVIKSFGWDDWLMLATLVCTFRSRSRIRPNQSPGLFHSGDFIPYMCDMDEGHIRKHRAQMALETT